LRRNAKNSVGATFYLRISLANKQNKSRMELVMKLFGNIKGRRGIAMTEYLIILAIVAIAAILIVGLFGQQIKNTFYRSTSTLGGTDANKSGASAITGSAKTAAQSTENMSTFDSKKNQKQ